MSQGELPARLLPGTILLVWFGDDTPKERPAVVLRDSDGCVVVVALSTTQEHAEREDHIACVRAGSLEAEIMRANKDVWFHKRGLLAFTRERLAGIYRGKALGSCPRALLRKLQDAALAHSPRTVGDP